MSCCALAVNIALGPGFYGLGVWTSEYSALGNIDSQAQHAMIKTYNLQCKIAHLNEAIWAIIAIFDKCSKTFMWNKVCISRAQAPKIKLSLNHPHLKITSKTYIHIYILPTKIWNIWKAPRKYFVFDILICWKWIGTNHKEILWL